MAHTVRVPKHVTSATRAAAARVQVALTNATSPGTDTLPRLWCLSPSEPGQAPSQTTEPVHRHRFVWRFLASLSALMLSVYHPAMPREALAEDWKPVPREPEREVNPRNPFGAGTDQRTRWRQDWKTDLYRSPVPPIRLAANEGLEGGSKQRFDIPPGDLEPALIAFSKQTGIQSLYSSGLVTGVQTQGLQGDYTPEEGLTGLLAGTGLAAFFSGPGTVTLQTAGGIVTPFQASSSELSKPVKVPEVVVKDVKERTPVVDSPDGYKADVSSEAVLRFPAEIQELPQSVSIVTRDSMRERRAVTQTQAMEGVAGIGKSTSTGSQSDHYFIRGFGANTATPGYNRDNGLAAFNNYVADPTLYERIEVIKGSASFTSGLVTAGGFVNRLLKAPVKENFVVAEAGGGSDGHYRTTLDANGVMPSIPQLSGRFVFTQNQDPEFFQNSGNQRFSFLPSVRFATEHDFSLTVTGNIQHLRGKGYYGTPTNTLGQIPAGIQDSLLGDDNQLKVDYQSVHVEAEKKFAQGFRLKVKGQHSHDSTSYRYAYGYQSGGIGPDGNFSIYGYGRDFKRESFAGEVNLVKEFSLFGHLSSVAAGMDYSMGRQLVKGAGFRSLGTGNLANPEVNIPFPPGFTDPATNLVRDLRVNQTGAFLQGLLRPFEGTTLMLALRQNWITEQQVGAATTEGVNVSRLTPQIGLSQRLIDGLNVYASYGESIQPNFALTADGSLLDPVTGQTFEIGSKWETIGHRLLLTAALFRTNLDNVATPDSANPTFSIGGQSQRNQGFEFEARGALLPELQANLAYTFLDTEVTKSTIPDSVGVRAMNAPKHTVSAFASYDFSKLLTEGLKLGAVVYYRSEVNAAVPFQNQTYEGYTRTDLFAIYAPLKWLSLQLNLNNLFDARYVEGINSYRGYNNFGAPRHVIGMLRLTF